MSQISRKINEGPKEKKQKSFAPGRNDMVKFRCYTRKVWSKLAGRLLTDNEVDKIIEDFGRFLEVLLNREVEKYENK